ncbi:MAG: CoA transferase [Acidobacteria bacterium]|nr:CoA transferase [Acidobacteriota bacterium]
MQDQYLNGVRVLDLTRLLPGGFCTLLLADMGAEVIKIEDPEQGDYFRSMPPIRGSQGAYFHAINGGKKSVVINLKSQEGISVFLRLVKDFDVVVESFRPGVTAKLGIHYEQLQRSNPHLIYCSISGYGQTGPFRSRAGHDLNYVGLAGLLSINKSSETQMFLCPPLGQISDIGAAYAAAFGISAALTARRQTLKGTYLDISMAEVALTFGLLRFVGVEAEAGDPEADGHRNQFFGDLACYNTYRTADGEFMTLAAFEPKFWAAFLSKVNRMDLLSKHLDLGHQQELKVELAQLFMQRSQAEWIALFADERDACCEPVLSGHNVLDQPQFRSRGMFARCEALQLASPSGVRPPRRPLAPKYGEHTVEVLASCGIAREEIQKLHRSGVIRALEKGEVTN